MDTRRFGLSAPKRPSAEIGCSILLTPAQREAISTSCVRRIARRQERPPLDTQALLKIPDAVSFLYDQSGGHSIYNALQVRLIHRFTHGVSFQGIYTYGKSLDNSSTIGGTSPTVVQQDGNTQRSMDSRRSTFATNCEFSPFTSFLSVNGTATQRADGKNTPSATGG